MSIKFNINSDKTLVGTFNTDGTVSVKSTHKNARNAERLESNISEIIEVINESELAYVFLKDTPYFMINKVNENVQTINELTSFETRIFAREVSPKIVPFARFTASDMPRNQLRTDIHTHFAATLTPEKLIECGIGRNVFYPEWLTNKLKLNTQGLQNSGSGYLLEDLLSIGENYETLVNAMKIDTSEQETFNKMEEIYTARGPITKHPDVFLPMLEQTAIDAMENGVTYMELSVSSIISDMEQLKIVEENLPRIERETGVKLRFLGAMSRHSDLEWNEDEVDKLKISARSPYIVGCDFMGHETNPTKDFYNQIKDLAKYSILNDPSFVIRVHAGENVIFKDNVRQSLLAVEEAHRELEAETGRELPYPQVRIGHGVYGFDQEPSWDEADWSSKLPTMELCRKIKPIIEFNMSSNLSLNNINSIEEIPIKKYIDSGIRVVLGTDGRGIYSTTIEQEMILAKQAGITKEDFDKIYETESEILELENKRFNALKTEKESLSSYIRNVQKRLKPHYTKEVEQKYYSELKSCQERLKAMIEKCGAETDQNQILQATNRKKPILITGSSHSHFPKIEAHPDQIKKIGVVFDVLLQTMDPNKAYLMTGGTNHGVEKMLHERAHEFNKHNNQKVVVLGTLTEEAAKDSNSEDIKKRNTNRIDENTITHAITPILNGKIAKRWFDLPDTVLDIVQQSHGTMIAIGGGSIVGDMITRAHNMGLSLNIMSSVEGASSDKAKHFNGNNYAFEDAKELIYKLLAENKSLMKKGLTEEKINEIIEEAIQKENGRTIVAVEKQ